MINSLSGFKVLLLQGPLGPFFRRLARDLESVGAQVTKVNFNGGDCLFYPFNALAFRRGVEEWPVFVEKLLVERRIDLVMLFGDCRPMHRIAREIAQNHHIEVAVFEEGYVRPDYITLERFGVNGNSLTPRDKNFYLNIFPAVPPAHALSVGKTFGLAAMWAMMYYPASVALQPFFRHYRHHRPLHLMEGLRWVRAYWRKKRYALSERGIAGMLAGPLSKKYFLVPLQVHNDAQIHTHSDFNSMENFIEYLIHSFATSAPGETALVIKHHPLDRGYHDYKKDISKLSRLYGVEHRVLYIHDQHLPTLLEHARGVVVVNSTVGLSALHHQTPLKVCGKAIYDIEGLTYQGSLENFWWAASACSVDMVLLQRFQNYLIEFTQVNGNFYKRLPVPGSNTGLNWVVSRREKVERRKQPRPSSATAPNAA